MNQAALTVLIIYFIPSAFIGFACFVAVLYNLEHHYDGTSRLIFESIGLTFFWPGSMVYWRYKANGYRIDWFLLPIAVLFYLGFVAAELSNEGSAGR